MKSASNFGIVVAAVCLIAFSLAASAAPPKGDDWVSLFNGEDLSGWKFESPEGAEVWSVKDGVIDCEPKVWPRAQKNLVSEREFGDYTLHIEWRIKEVKGIYNVPNILPDGSEEVDADGKMITTPMPGADSGIYVRGEGKSQVNIWCWPIGSGEVYGYRRDKNMPAEVRAGVVPKAKADKPVGEWNTFRITMRGDRLTVVLNGEKVIDRAKLPGVPERGPLVLQHHGGWDEKKQEWNGASALVQFRNIFIRELPPRGEGKKKKAEN